MLVFSTSFIILRKSLIPSHSTSSLLTTLISQGDVSKCCFVFSKKEMKYGHHSSSLLSMLEPSFVGQSLLSNEVFPLRVSNQILYHVSCSLYQLFSSHEGSFRLVFILHDISSQIPHSASFIQHKINKSSLSSCTSFVSILTQSPNEIIPLPIFTSQHFA